MTFPRRCLSGPSLSTSGQLFTKKDGPHDIVLQTRPANQHKPSKPSHQSRPMSFGKQTVPTSQLHDDPGHEIFMVGKSRRRTRLRGSLGLRLNMASHSSSARGTAMTKCNLTRVTGLKAHRDGRRDHCVLVHQSQAAGSDELIVADRIANKLHLSRRQKICELNIRCCSLPAVSTAYYNEVSRCNIVVIPARTCIRVWSHE